MSSTCSPDKVHSLYRRTYNHSPTQPDLGHRKPQQHICITLHPFSTDSVVVRFLSLRFGCIVGRSLAGPQVEVEDDDIIYSNIKILHNLQNQTTKDKEFLTETDVVYSLLSSSFETSRQ
ncbi:hypothetical protein Q8A73_012578 [Channa argus]|nr:hypothetical protein Q8A73_012578 [Channa argus]